MDIKEVLKQKEYLKQDLFVRGFLLTNKKPNLDEFPFFGLWKCEEYDGFYFIYHSKTKLTTYKSDNRNYFIFGNVYNPFSMEYEEKEILKDISKKDFIEGINDITGIFTCGYIEDGKVIFLSDPSGMQSVFCGIIDDNFYLTSHAQLVGDICNLTMDAFVNKLINYKWYHRVMGPYLPADLSPFKELKRVVPDILYTYDGNISHYRFWPLEEAKIVDNDGDYASVIKEGATILSNNMKLISQKWKKPWISLTGGIDSNTTFAAANGIYDKFETFSYLSAEKEIKDAEAAKIISDRFGITNHRYNIPEAKDIKDFEERKELFLHNNGYVGPLYENELRKKLFLHDNLDIDVEVKSWVSETIRGYIYKHYGRKKFPKMSPKLFRNFYKIFITNRRLAHQIDKIFKEYIKEYEYDKIPNTYPISDIFFSEVTWGSWGGMNITEMRYCFDITIAYNNRRFLESMFRIPLPDRISDKNHLELKKYLNKDLYDMNIRVVNLKETNTRAFLLNFIFVLNTILPY